MSTAEMLLALRSPNSGWLAAVLCALDEALQDPDFDDAQRAVVRELLDRSSMPLPVAIAAQQRMEEFEQAIHPILAIEPMPALVSQRPKLTLCVSHH